MGDTRILGALLALCSLGAAEVISFDRSTPGKVPAGWTVAMTHEGAAPRSAPRPPYILAQLSRDSTAGRFPMAIWEGVSIRDGEVSVAFKTAGGAVDQAAGIVCRYRDQNNYYIARANALENVSIASKGLPSRSYGVKHEIPRGRWTTLKIEFNDNLFTVLLNGERLFDAEDRTIANAGKTGLWTKADSVTYFSEFSVNGK